MKSTFAGVAGGGSARVRARKAARPLLSPRALLDSAPVCVQGGLAAIPEPEFPPAHWAREMDMDDKAEVDRWLAIHNEAFRREWSRDQFRESVLEHPHYDIQRTFFLCDPDGPVGTISVGIFRRNPAIGVGHYLAIVPRSQRLGLGRQLSLFRSQKLRELGLTWTESETQIMRIAAVRVLFGLGSEPKFELDHWNTPDKSPALVRAITRWRLNHLFREWERTARAS